jgi:hypothetical protein
MATVESVLTTPHINPPLRSTGGVRPAGRELTPAEVLADLLGEKLRLDGPEKVAQMIVERLADAGFVIWPTEAPKPPRKP